MTGEMVTYLEIDVPYLDTYLVLVEPRFES